jgi:hypothetical protein
MWYCGVCDCDFCLVHGYTHGPYGYNLEYYEIPAPTPVPVVTAAEQNVTIYTQLGFLSISPELAKSLGIA